MNLIRIQQKNEKTNATETLDSYHPGIRSDKEEIYINEKNKNSVWKPD